MADIPLYKNKTNYRIKKLVAAANLIIYFYRRVLHYSVSYIMFYLKSIEFVTQVKKIL